METPTQSEKKWFLNDKNEIRYAIMFVVRNKSYNFDTTHIVVSMENEKNTPWLSDNGSGCRLEEVNVKNFYQTRKDCQIEILIRERFK